jgi:colicin import membrane protein
MRVRAAGSGVLVAVLSATLAAFAQTPPPQQQQPPPKPPEKQQPAKEPAKKAKKVWTNDDLGQVRKASDKYVDQKEADAAKAAAEKAAAEKAAKEGKEAEGEKPQVPIDPKTGKPYEDPDSVPALEKAVKGWEDELKRSEEQLDVARREMANAANPDRWESAKTKVDVFEQNIIDIKKKIEETKAQLAEAKKQQKPPAKSETPKP